MRRERPKSERKAPVEREVSTEIMTVREIAQYLKVHTATVYGLVAEGRLPFFRLGYDLRFRRKEIERWIETLHVDSSRSKARLRRN
jgi:excisionase family DNA binding protein